MALEADAVHRHALRSQRAHQVVHRGALRVDPLDVVVVDAQPRVRVGRAGVAERVGDVGLPERVEPEAGPQPAVVVEHLVDHVPRDDGRVGGVAADERGDVVLHRGAQGAAPSPCTQDGVWLCQTSVWPCTCWAFCCANATTWSAPAKFHEPSDGSVASHFIAFSAVTWLNSAAARDRYAASLASGPVAAAYPMNLPRAAACVRSGSSAAAGAAATNDAASRATAARAAAIRAWWRMAEGPFETGVRRPRPPGEREAHRWKRSQYRPFGRPRQRPTGRPDCDQSA